MSCQIRVLGFRIRVLGFSVLLEKFMHVVQIAKGIQDDLGWSRSLGVFKTLSCSIHCQSAKYPAKNDNF